MSSDNVIDLTELLQRSLKGGGAAGKTAAPARTGGASKSPARKTATRTKSATKSAAKSTRHARKAA
jgi:DNA end-binding protein Ku